MSSTIWLSGGTGLMGGRLLARRIPHGDRFRVVTRRPERITAQEGREPVGWDGLHPDPGTLDGVDAIVHLAGEPVFGGVPTRARRTRIWDSRVLSTRALVDAVAAQPEEARPHTLVCASAVGYYGTRGDDELPEEAPPGEGFLADLCVAWEAEAARAEALGLRVVSLRFGVVLARDGGALALMAPIFRAGLGGRLGDGRQWFPWIHVDDAVTQIEAALDETSMRGPVNVVSPNPVRNVDYTKVLGRVLRRPTVFAVPGFAVKTALGPLADELLGSKRVRAHPAARFAWADLEPALRAELDGGA